MSDLVTFGETMALVSAADIGPLRHARQMHLGIAGAESNVAIGMVRLGSTASWTGRIGDDELGRLVAMTVRGQDVDTTAIVDPDAPTGLMLKERRTSQSARVTYYRAGSAGSRLGPDDVDEHSISAARVLHLSGITTALSASAREAAFAAIEIAHSSDTLVSWDLNYRSALWGPDEAARTLLEVTERADIVFATTEEARLLCDGTDADELAAGLAKLGPRDVMIKSGARGALALLSGLRYVVDPEIVQAIDHVGAGDAFTAGYLSSLCKGNDPETRLRTASRAGAYAVTVAGDWEGLPLRDEFAALGDGGDLVCR